MTPWTAAHQAFLSFTISRSLLKFMSIESVMLCNHLIPSPPSPLAFSLSQHQGLFQWVGSLHHVAKVLELQHQHCLSLCLTHCRSLINGSPLGKLLVDSKCWFCYSFFTNRGIFCLGEAMASSDTHLPRLPVTREGHVTHPAGAMMHTQGLMEEVAR